MFVKQLIQNADDIAGRETPPDADGQPLARELVHYRQTFELPAILGLIKDKIVAPHVVRKATPMYSLRGGS